MDNSKKNPVAKSTNASRLRGPDRRPLKAPDNGRSNPAANAMMRAAIQEEMKHERDHAWRQRAHHRKYSEGGPQMHPKKLIDEVLSDWQL